MLYFLEAKVPLCKTFEQKNKGFKKTPYPLTKAFTSHAEDVTTIQQFHERLVYHFKLGHALIKGELTRELNLESRAGSTDPFLKTNWLCLDFDCTESEADAESIIAQLGLRKVSYIRQYSASHSITKNFSAHYFFMLDTPVLPELLKMWLMEQNLQIPQLANQMTLTRTNAALRWPLDVGVAQNDKIIYITAPRCIGFDDPLTDRIELIELKHDSADIQPMVDDVDTEVIEQAKLNKLNELRKAKKLKPRRATISKTFAGVEIASNPGKTTVTGYKEGRGFMYLNLNGGDSWGYYHPVDNPEIIYNFKGEQNYLAKELIPEYYRAYKKAEFQEPSETKHLAFLDRQTDQYYRGTFEDGVLELFPTSTVKKVEDFLKQHQQPVPDYIEEWDYKFRFDDERVFVPEEKFINRFCETPYLKEGKQTAPPEKFPPTIGRVLQSVTGGDKKVLAHFMNWMAVIIQKRQRTQTAWIFNGIQGTGKGVLVHEILKPIIGDQCVQVKSLADLDEQYTAYMENCVLLMVDESKRTQIKSLDKVLGKIKQCITDPVVPIRAMRTDHYMAKNYMNVIFTSNYPDPLTIERTDRRFNVGDYQTKKLNLTHKDIALIHEELPTFAALLYNWEASVEQAKTPLNNEARQHLMYLTQSSFEIVFGAVVEGNLQFFIDELPTDDTITVDPMATMKEDQYVSILREAQHSVDAGEPHRITRDQAWAIIEYTLGKVAETPNKFSALAKHHGLTFARKRKGDKSVQCMDVDWKPPEHRIEEVLEDKKLRAVK